MTLREKIEGLHTAKTGWVKLADVLRIVAEHEQAQAPVLDLTPGGPVKGGDCPGPKGTGTNVPCTNGREVTAPPVGQAGGEPERWDKNLPSTQIPAYLCAACTLEVEVGETFGFCPKCSKPLEMNPRWVAETPEVEQMARQQEPAEVPRWSGCHANRDGDCNWTDCPQAHDGEPARSGRSCPLWTGEDES